MLHYGNDEFQANDSNKKVIGSLLIGCQTNLQRVDDFGNFLAADALDGEFKEDFDNAVYILNENVILRVYFNLVPRLFPLCEDAEERPWLELVT